MSDLFEGLKDAIQRMEDALSAYGCHQRAVIDIESTQVEWSKIGGRWGLRVRENNGETIHLLSSSLKVRLAVAENSRLVIETVIEAKNAGDERIRKAIHLANQEAARLEAIVMGDCS